MEQMGYQAESATWRNAYLFGALELRRGMMAPAAPARAGRDIVRSLTPRPVLRFPRRAPQRRQGRGQDHRRQLGLPEPERYALTLQNCALTYLADRHAEAADATVTLDRTVLNRIILRELALPEAMAQGLVKSRRPDEGR